MTISRSEFMRLLPAAVAGTSFEAREQEIVHSDAVRGWRISIEPLSDLALGPVRLPRQRVSFEFAGHSQAEMEAFLRRFDLYFARAGG